MSIFELVMLLCFGAAWPFSIHKSLTSHSVTGKSLVFLLVVWAGYLAGILNKILYHPDIIIVFYVINMTMVSIDTILHLRNRKKIVNNKTDDQAASN